MMEDLTSEELFDIVHDEHYPYEMREQAWDLFRLRPDFDLVMYNALAAGETP